jgi:ribosomal protein S12
MNQRIIYKTDEGGVAVIIPAVSVELAMKDIPDGVQYKIVDVADIPSDRTFRDAWTVDTTGWETK